MTNIPFYKSKAVYLGIIRYFLGLIMIAYGISKILRAQIVVVPSSMWQRPLEYVSGKSLAWAFLGYSAWFQTLLGLLEFFPGVLLLFRRTTLAGSLLLLPVTLNVYLINQALDLWADTKVLSLILVILNLILILMEWEKIKNSVSIILDLGKRFKTWRGEILVNLLVIIGITCLAVPSLWSYIHEKDSLTGDWYHGHPNEWILRSEKAKDTTFHTRPLRCYFGARGQYSELNDTGFVKNDLYKYTLDEKQHLLKFYHYNDKSVIECNYSLVEDSILILHRPADGVNSVPLTQEFERRIMTTSR